MRSAPATGLLLTLAVVAVAAPASGAPPTKEECIETHSKAQDYRDRGQMSDAKRLFMLCAQQSCPALIQSDCAKFGEDLARSVPSVSFSARDAKGNDLPDTQVFVDGQLITSRLDDGKAHDIDPGKHAIRFTHSGKEATVNVVISVGEKGRNIMATIDDPGASGAGSSSSISTEDGRSSSGSRSALPLVVAGVGGAALVTGIVLAVVGKNGVPSVCSTSTNECAAPPGDPVFNDAKSSMQLANLGIGIGITGLVLGVGGLIWYLSSAPSKDSAAALAPRLLHPHVGGTTTIVRF